MPAAVCATIATLKVIVFGKNQQTVLPIKIGLVGFAGLFLFHE
jgi:hypothetical protein